MAEEQALREAVPAEAEPIYEYIQSCLDQVGERGVRLLGERGGYITKQILVLI